MCTRDRLRVERVRRRGGLLASARVDSLHSWAGLRARGRCAIVRQLRESSRILLLCGLLHDLERLLGRHRPAPRSRPSGQSKRCVGRVVRVRAARATAVELLDQHFVLSGDERARKRDATAVPLAARAAALRRSGAGRPSAHRGAVAHDGWRRNAVRTRQQGSFRRGRRRLRLGLRAWRLGELHAALSATRMRRGRTGCAAPRRAWRRRLGLQVLRTNRSGRIDARRAIQRLRWRTRRIDGDLCVRPVSAHRLLGGRARIGSRHSAHTAQIVETELRQRVTRGLVGGRPLAIGARAHAPARLRRRDALVVPTCRLGLRGLGCCCIRLGGNRIACRERRWRCEASGAAGGRRARGVRRNARARAACLRTRVDDTPHARMDGRKRRRERGQPLAYFCSPLCPGSRARALCMGSQLAACKT